MVNNKQLPIRQAQDKPKPNILSNANITQLIKIQNELKLMADSTANYKNFSFEYISLIGLMNVLLPVLEKYNFLLTQAIILNAAETQEIIHTKIKHINGEFIESKVLVQHDWDDIKDWGGYVTYKRRTALMALLGIHYETNDENNSTPNSGDDIYITSKQVNKLLYELSNKKDKKEKLIKQYGSLEQIPKTMMSDLLLWINATV